MALIHVRLNTEDLQAALDRNAFPDAIRAAFTAALERQRMTRTIVYEGTAAEIEGYRTRSLAPGSHDKGDVTITVTEEID